MFHCDAVDTSPDLGGKNVIKTVEMGIRHDGRKTRMDLEFSVAGFFFTCVQKYFSGSLRGGDRGCTTDVDRVPHTVSVSDPMWC